MILVFAYRMPKIINSSKIPMIIEKLIEKQKQKKSIKIFGNYNLNHLNYKKNTKKKKY